MKAKTKTPSYIPILNLNGRQYMAKNIIVTDNDAVRTKGLISYLTGKLRNIKSSQLNLCTL